MKMKGKELKELLIQTGEYLVENCDNICDFDVEREKLILEINQSKNFYYLGEPLEDYEVESEISDSENYDYIIQDKKFKWLGCDSFNTTIYRMTIKFVN